MGRFLISLGVVILLAGVTLFSQYERSTDARATSFARIGAGFDSVLQVPREEINQRIFAANDIADAANSKGISHKRDAQNLLYLIFGLGGLTSILAGIQKSVAASTAATLTLVLGLLGAGSAIATAGSKLVGDMADKHFACVGDLEKKVNETIASLREETDATAAQQYLGEMDRAAARCAP